MPTWNTNEQPILTTLPIEDSDFGINLTQQFADLEQDFVAVRESVSSGFAPLYTTDTMDAPTENVTYLATRATGEVGDITYNNLKLANGSAAPPITVTSEELLSLFVFLIYNATTDSWSKDVKTIEADSALNENSVKPVQNAPVASAINKLNTAFIDTPTESNFSENYTTPAPTWNNVTSTFAGFGTNIGAKQNFNHVSFSIRGKTGITTPITKCKVFICENNKAGAVLATGEVTGISVASAVVQQVNILLNATIENTSASNLYLLYMCDNLVDHWGNINNSVFPRPTYPIGSYVTIPGGGGYTYANVQPSNFVNNTDTANQQTLRVTMSLSSVGVSLTNDQIEDIGNRLPPVTGDAVLNESSTELIQNAPVAVAINKLNENFEEVDVITDPIANYEGSAAWILTASTFTGFSSNLGAIKNFNRVRIKIRAKSTVTVPITKCKLFICDVNKSGTVLATVEVTGLNLAATQEATLTFNLPTTIANAAGNNLWAAWVADGMIDYWGVNSNTYYPNPTYPQMAYSTSTSYATVTAASFVNTAGSVNYTSLIETFYEGLGQQPTNFIVQNIAERISIAPKTVDVILPDKITAVVGEKILLFFRGMIKLFNPYTKNILVSCVKGNQYPRYFEFTPVTGDVGTHSLKVQVKDDDGTVVGEDTTNLQVVSAGVNPATPKTALIVGDSNIANGEVAIEAARRLNGTGGSPAGKGFSNALFKGRKTSGAVGWEGTGGWQWSNYTTAGTTAQRFTVSGVVTAPGVGSKYTHNGTLYEIQEVNITSGSGNIRAVVYVAGPAPTASGTLTKSEGVGDATIAFSSFTTESGNPFWNTGTGQLDIVSYVNTYCGGDLDAVYFYLTWNGQTPWRTNFDTFKSQARILFDHIHANYPVCKIVVMGVHTPSVNGGMGANYGATGTSYADGYGMFVTALNMNIAYQELANESAYSSFVEFVNVSAQVDMENNGQQADTAVNTRNTATEKRGTNGVHPSLPGYLQIADVVFRNFIANFCQ